MRPEDIIAKLEGPTENGWPLVRRLIAHEQARNVSAACARRFKFGYALLNDSHGFRVMQVDPSS
jgi:hypothetical protein